jgi:rhodanese-related sulfurtransferase
MRLQSAVLSFCLAPALALAQIQVVGDDACPGFAVDIAAFATCDGDRVAPPSGLPALRIAAMSLDEVPPHKRSESALFVSAAEALRIRRAYPGEVVLIDIRSRIEVAYVGQPDMVDIHVPYLEPAQPLQWNAASNGLRLERNPTFVDEIKAALARLDGPAEPTLLLLCRSGQRSAIAADALAAAGLDRVYTVVDGFEGDLGPDGRCNVNGWKVAGGSWQSRPALQLTSAAAL